MIEFLLQVSKTGDKSKTYEQFVAEFPAGQCRYGVFDVEYTDPKTGGQRNKIVFYSWYAIWKFAKSKMFFTTNADTYSHRSMKYSYVFFECPSKNEIATHM